MGVHALRTGIPDRLKPLLGWSLAFLGWTLLSSLWSREGQGWAALQPALQGAAALAILAGLAAGPGLSAVLRWILPGAGLAVLIFALNLLTGGGVERLCLGGTLSGSPIDHHPFGNRNTAALLLMMLLPPAAFAPSPWRWILGLPLGLLLWWTGSLGALAGLGGGGLLTWAATRPSAHRAKAWILSGLLMAPLTVAALTAVHMKPDWRLTTTLGLRSLAWESAARAWREAPLLGHGAGSFALRFPDFRAPDYPASVHATPRVLHAYNAPLQILAETGLVGFVLAGLALRAGWRAWRANGAPAPAAAWVVAALLVHALGGDALVDPLGLAGLAVGAAVCLQSPVGARSGSRLLPPLLALLALAGLALSLLTIAQALLFAQAWTLKARQPAKALAGFAAAASGPRIGWLHLDARFEEAKLRLALEGPAEASSAWERLQTCGGPYGNARREQARAALADGDTAKAARLLEAHLDFLGTDAEALRLLALSGRVEAVRERLSATLARVPDAHPFLPGAEALLTDLGDRAGAWEVSRRILDAYPSAVHLEEAAAAGLTANQPIEVMDLLGRYPPEALAPVEASMDALLVPGADLPLAHGLRAAIRSLQGDAAGAARDLEAVPDSLSWKAGLADAIKVGRRPPSGPGPRPPPSSR